MLQNRQVCEVLNSDPCLETRPAADMELEHPPQSFRTVRQPGVAPGTVRGVALRSRTSHRARFEAVRQHSGTLRCLPPIKGCLQAFRASKLLSYGL